MAIYMVSQKNIFLINKFGIDIFVDKSYHYVVTNNCNSEKGRVWYERIKNLHE